MKETNELVGKIFASSWGYDQTNIDFYKVVSVSPSGKTATLQPIANKIVDVVNQMAEMVVPNESVTKGAPLTCRVTSNSGGSSFQVRSFARAYPWNGSPLEQTHFH